MVEKYVSPPALPAGEATRHRRNLRVLFICAASALLLLLAYVFLQLPESQFNYAFPRRAWKSAAIILAGSAVAVSSLLFQSITNNRILTPAIIGFDSLYLLIQGVTVFAVSASGADKWGAQPFFLVNLALMIGFSELLFRFLFQREQSYIYFILLAGVVCGMVFRSGFTFFSLLLDPDEFDIVQTKMFASFNTVSPELVMLSGVIILCTLAYTYRLMTRLDVFLLGREHAHNLGIDTAKLQQHVLRIVAVLVSVSTALVGPVTFLGILVVNIAYGIFDTYRHRLLLAGSICIACGSLFGGLILVERVFEFSTNLTVILNGIGGSYFLYLLMKEGR